MTTKSAGWHFPEHRSVLPACRQYAPDKLTCLLIILLFFGFYLPLLFGPDHAYLTIHDNLDGEVPQNAVLATFYLHPSHATHLLLGGRLPIYLLPRLTWPLSLIGLIHNTYWAYVLTDIVVRVVAALGMYLLAGRIGIQNRFAALAGCLFSLSLSYTVQGFSIAAIPAVVYLFQPIGEKGRRYAYLALFILGWNSALFMSGVFLLLLLPVLQPVVFGKACGKSFAPYAAYGLGLAAGSAGLIAAMLIGQPLHRSEWVLSGLTTASALKTFLHNQLSCTTWDFYHVSTPLVFIYIAVIAAAVILKDRRLYTLVAIVVSINLFYCLVHLEAAANWRNHIGGLAKTFQFDRFYTLDSALIVLCWIVAMGLAQPRLRAVLATSAGLQLLWTLALTPHIQNPVLHALGKPSLPSFDQYYLPADYKTLKDTVETAATISVGLDPMVAVENGIAALDGYYSAYPLSYKARFRSIVAGELTLSGAQAYFDNWGNRLYTFANDPRVVSLNYCAAAALGARFAISQFDLADSKLHLVRVTEPSHVRLYSIDCPASSAK